MSAPLPVDYVAALRELIHAFPDHDMLTATQETFAEQARETLHYAAVRLAELGAEVASLSAEVAKLVDVIRLCRPYIWSDAHSEEADCDCDYMMDEVLKQYGVKRSAG